jgi:hypothetical protein
LELPSSGTAAFSNSAHRPRKRSGHAPKRDDRSTASVWR